MAAANGIEIKPVISNQKNFWPTARDRIFMGGAAKNEAWSLLLWNLRRAWIEKGRSLNLIAVTPILHHDANGGREQAERQDQAAPGTARVRRGYRLWRSLPAGAGCP